MLRILLTISVLIFAWMQTGCYKLQSFKTPAYIRPSMQKTHHLKEPKFLIEYSSTWDLNRLSLPHYIVVSPAIPGIRGSHFHHDDEGGIVDIPTLHEYLANSHIWKNWQERFSSDEFRIIDLLPRGTPYKIIGVNTDKTEQVTKIFIQIYNRHNYVAEYVRPTESYQ